MKDFNNTLDSLNLQSNNIQSIPADLFTGGFKVKDLVLTDNPVTDWTGLDMNTELTNLTATSDMGSSISMLTSKPLVKITLQNQSATALPDFSNSELHNVYITNSDIQDISSIGDALNLPEYHGRTSSTNAIIYDCVLNNNDLQDAHHYQAWRFENKRIDVHFKLILDDNSHLEDLMLFEGSYQSDDWTHWYPKSSHNMSVKRTNVSNTPASLGVARNFKHLASLNISECKNFTTLSLLFTKCDEHSLYERETYYDNHAFHSVVADHTNLNDMSWMLGDSFAGCEKIYMRYCLDLDYHTLHTIKDELITLKQNNQIRLTDIHLNSTKWDEGLKNCKLYPRCANGSYTQAMQLKKDLHDAGIYIHGTTGGLEAKGVFPNCNTEPACPSPTPTPTPSITPSPGAGLSGIWNDSLVWNDNSNWNE